ncbi:MAG: hypothetical protein IJ593_11430 [Lachnospiraceae bacterium]|nr:hypothetical protein [Lachnospiraceae bacterium]
MNPFDEIIKHNDIVFFDIDGTLARFRATKNRTVVGGDTWLEMCMGSKNPYLNTLTAIETMKTGVARLDQNRVYVLGQVDNSFEVNHKLQFLDLNYPSIIKSHIIFVAKSEQKIDVMKVMHRKLTDKKMIKSIKQMVLVEDRLDTIELAEKEGFTTYHISCFIE